jgi:hypothetical protein
MHAGAYWDDNNNHIQKGRGAHLGDWAARIPGCPLDHHLPARIQLELVLRIGKEGDELITWRSQFSPQTLQD